jgi:hypothetical protein
MEMIWQDTIGDNTDTVSIFFHPFSDIKQESLEVFERKK